MSDHLNEDITHIHRAKLVIRTRCDVVAGADSLQTSGGAKYDGRWRSDD